MISDEERRVLAEAQAVLSREGIASPGLQHALVPPEEQARRNQAYYRALDAASERSRIAQQRRETTPARLRFFMSEEAEKAGLEPPRRAYPDDAGFDLRAFAPEELRVGPGDRVMIPTGVGFEIPEGWWGHIRSRTSMGKKGLIPAAQVVDSNYTGILTICLANVSRGVIVLEPGERVAQIVFTPHWSLPINRIDRSEVKVTERGSGAFGSSGRH